ncbi:YqgE/AlgH family protein [Gallaecimonas kandeliae]|uniref:YqgE/AlgH family protein n=1 Tax=Gallaecimonas kandeliae TaxID=3029055 RepID=UPI002647097F|nr:YqgE/AlgH family protein [Gallaecimonas kandeliae]WKE66181.1 YqgE/AlgH family protein [Gallaecimonas kandeliae]
MRSLQNHFLIATPAMRDPFFARSVTYLCEHNDEGAMGLVVNHPVNITLVEMLRQLQLVDEQEEPEQLHGRYVYSGGPVNPERGFVIHSPKRGFNASLELGGDIMVTTSVDILSTLGGDQGPERFMVTLGYAGWEPGQLEKELNDNSWLLVPAEPGFAQELLFNTPPSKRWEKACEELGFDIWHLSNDVGHA